MECVSLSLVDAVSISGNGRCREAHGDLPVLMLTCGRVQAQGMLGIHATDRVAVILWYMRTQFCGTYDALAPPIGA